MDRAVLLRERTLRLPVVVLVATLAALTLAVMVFAAVVVVYRVGDLELAPVTFVMGSYFTFPHELLSHVPIPKDGNLPVPSL